MMYETLNGRAVILYCILCHKFLVAGQAVDPGTHTRGGAMRQPTFLWAQRHGGDHTKHGRAENKLHWIVAAEAVPA